MIVLPELIDMLSPSLTCELDASYKVTQKTWAHLALGQTAICLRVNLAVLECNLRV